MPTATQWARLVTPETLLAWHHRVHHPQVDLPETARPRLGCQVSQATVRQILRACGYPPAPPGLDTSWRRFLRVLMMRLRLYTSSGTQIPEPPQVTARSVPTGPFPAASGMLTMKA